VVVSAEIISALAPGATCVGVLPGVDGNPSGHGEDFELTRSVPGRRRGALEGVEVDRGPRRPCAVRLLLPCVVQGSVGAGLEHFEASVRVRDDGCVYRQVSAETGGAATIRCWAALAICGAARACPCPQSQAITWSRSSALCSAWIGTQRRTWCVLPNPFGTAWSVPVSWVDAWGRCRVLLPAPARPDPRPRLESREFAERKWLRRGDVR
jgi:hypothetical protein